MSSALYYFPMYFPRVTAGIYFRLLTITDGDGNIYLSPGVQLLA